MINVSNKVETTLVEVSAGLIAVGSAGLVLASYLTDVQIKSVVASVSGALVTSGGAIIAVWHKFVNVFEETKEVEIKPST